MTNFYMLYSDDSDDKKLIAEIIEFSDDQVVVKWCMSTIRSLVIHASLDDFINISINGTKRQLTTAGSVGW